MVFILRVFPISPSVKNKITYCFLDKVFIEYHNHILSVESKNLEGYLKVRAAVKGSFESRKRDGYYEYCSTHIHFPDELTPNLVNPLPEN
jgi:hypothetical protein